MMTAATILFFVTLVVFWGAILGAALLFVWASIQHVRTSSAARRASTDFTSAPPHARHA